MRTETSTTFTITLENQREIDILYAILSFGPLYDLADEIAQNTPAREGGDSYNIVYGLREHLKYFSSFASQEFEGREDSEKIIKMFNFLKNKSGISEKDIQRIAK